MRIEIPECRRCCLCVPLRLGIIIFGYINLLFAFLVLIYQIIYQAGRGKGVAGMTFRDLLLYLDASMYIQAWLPVFLYMLEVIFNIALLAGAHMKQVKLLRVYYYYGVTTTVASMMVFVVRHETKYDFNLLEFSIALCGFIIHAYLLLLVRTELTKRRYRGSGISYVNHITEAPLQPPHLSEADS